jgi:hypothetical protein
MNTAIILIICKTFVLYLGVKIQMQNNAAAKRSTFRPQHSKGAGKNRQPNFLTFATLIKHFFNTNDVENIPSTLFTKK